MKQKGLKWILIGFAIFLVGIIGIPYGFILPLLKGNPSENAFKVPTERFSYMAKEPGRFFVWNVHQTQFEGEEYFSDASLPPALKVEIRNPSGEVLPFHPYPHTTITNFSSSKISVGYVDLQSPTELVLQVSGLEKSRIFSVSQDLLSRNFKWIVLTGILVLVISFGGALMTLWGVLLLACSRNPQALAYMESNLPLRKKLKRLLFNR